MFYREKENITQFSSNFSINGVISNSIVVFLAGIIILSSYYALNIAKKCRKNSGKNDALLRNEKILTTCMGLGVGLASFMLLDIFINKVILISVGVLVVTLSAVVIQSYEKLEDTPKCKEKIQSMYSFMHWLMGAGIGIISFTILSKAMTAIKNPLTKFRTMIIIMSLVSIFIASVSINTTNSCKTKIKSSSNTSSIIILVINIVVFIAIAVSFKYIK